ncbi:hypothetical protein [Lentzea sp. NPDC060358]|uniref:hypothetical protein n=1 Tax=Lentzea sp. NPDC060358 TaxID=3347103 RepID=UPI00364EB875
MRIPHQDQDTPAESAAPPPSARAKVFSGAGVFADVAAVVVVLLEGRGAVAAVVAAIAVLAGIGTIALRFRGSLRIGLIILTVAAVVLTIAYLGPERVRGWIKPPGPGADGRTSVSHTTSPPAPPAPPVKVLEMPLHMPYKPPQNSLDLETSTFPVSSTDKSADIAIECRDVEDFRSSCPPGGTIDYYAEPLNGTELVAADSPDPAACRDRAGYSGSQVPVRQSAFYCLRTTGAYAVLRITSAPVTRPAGAAEVITVRLEVTMTAR